MDTQPQEAIVKESVRALLAGAIDYAGLFPPSQLSMSEAVLNYATYRNSNYAWMLGRFVVTAARLDEFYESATDFITRDERERWHVAVVAAARSARRQRNLAGHSTTAVGRRSAVARDMNHKAHDDHKER